MMNSVPQFLHFIKKWVVYCKPPFDSVGKVISYLGRYTHRVAISNDKILLLKDGKVTFRWRDYAHNNQVSAILLCFFLCSKILK